MTPSARSANLTAGDGKNHDPGWTQRVQKHTECHPGLPRWLLRVIGASMVNPQDAEAEDEQSGVNARREWSEAELTDLGNMLLRGVPIEEIARVLRRAHHEVRDKVAEVGRACR